MHGCYNSSIKKKYVLHDSLLDYNIYQTRDIQKFGTYLSVIYQLII